MCTALSFHGLFGRTLDLEWSLNEQVTITPRHFPLALRRLPGLDSHYAFIGMAHVEEGFPLYYDGINEHGLAIAGLNFPHSAKYQPQIPGKDNIAAFEVIPWLRGDCRTVSDARRKLENSNMYKLKQP